MQTPLKSMRKGAGAVTDWSGRYSFLACQVKKNQVQMPTTATVWGYKKRLYNERSVTREA